ncbi:peptide deformylase [Glycomyces sp. A-F 0318]|uniref:peptide deformylase n=1 Tax=Glycomyces amatae TaxID=2881355 RepID=UPI001E52D2DE|nr:peptide deformylase [Glycomyces amatae]MCD0442917.1 peptide deformylase [Glycomyces amatae]
MADKEPPVEEGAEPGANGRVHPIVHYGDPVLHRACKPVEAFDDALAQLVEDMFASMYAANGVGLAANQIGVDARVFVLDCEDADGVRTVAAVVNPVLALPAPPRELMTGDEGCLSVPGSFEDTARSATAAVEGFDAAGAPVRIEGTGTLSRCLQHEYDHLEGTVYVDRLPRKARNRALTGAGLR